MTEQEGRPTTKLYFCGIKDRQEYTECDGHESPLIFSAKPRVKNTFNLIKTEYMIS